MDRQEARLDRGTEAERLRGVVAEGSLRRHD